VVNKDYHRTPSLFVGRSSVWRVWVSVVVDGHRLNAVVDQPLDVARLVADVGQNLTSDLRDDVTDDDVTGVESCLRVVITDVVSRLDFDYLSRLFTDTYRPTTRWVMVKWYSSSPETHLRATERHLPYGIT